MNLTSSGTYLDTLINAAGCDSVITLNLNVGQTFTSLSSTLCFPDTYNFGGVILSTSGVYVDTIVTSINCDSIITLNLIVNSPSDSIFNVNICSPDSYSFNGSILNVSGQYFDTLVNAINCDSLITLNLTVLDPSAFAFEDSVCTPDVYLFNGLALDSTGIYTYILQNAVGCDSLITLDLTVNQSIAPFNINDTICCLLDTIYYTAPFYSNAEYLWNGIDTGISYSVFTEDLFTLSISNVCGTEQDSWYVDTKECDLLVHIPNAFTPNKDGLNEIFIPIFTDYEDIYNYEFKIFNRWGELLFSTTNPLKGWNAIHNGELVQKGSYSYTLYYSGYRITPRFVTGSFSIIR